MAEDADTPVLVINMHDHPRATSDADCGTNIDHNTNTRRGRSHGGSFIPGNGKNWGEHVPWYSHFLETHTVKQHHMCNIPHIGYTD